MRQCLDLGSCFLRHGPPGRGGGGGGTHTVARSTPYTLFAFGTDECPRFGTVRKVPWKVNHRHVANQILFTVLKCPENLQHRPCKIVPIIFARLHFPLLPMINSLNAFAPQQKYFPGGGTGQLTAAEYYLRHGLAACDSDNGAPSGDAFEHPKEKTFGGTFPPAGGGGSKR